jgi:alpha-L-arabinofuranosidase
VEYCNAPVNQERTENGAADPFNVKYWASRVRLPDLPFAISCEPASDKPLPDGCAIALDEVTEDGILHQRRLLDRVDPSRKVGLVLEVGMAGGAVATGLRLNAIHRQADNVVMCNAALDGLLVFENGKCRRTQTYFTYLLAKAHRGKTAVKATPPQASLTELSVSASRRDNSLVITVVNPRSDAAVRMRCLVHGRAAERVSARTLSEYSLGVPQNVEVRVRADGMLAELPAMSVSTLVIETKL